MPEIPDVILSEFLEVEWGNAIRDRTVQRYDDEATRTSENTSPSEGDLAFMEDSFDLDIFMDSDWQHVGVPVGTILMNAAANAPTGFLVCNGASLLRTDYPALFAALSTTWGSVDGTHFNIPDMRGRVPRGVAASGTGNSLGGTFGSDTHTHTNPTTSSDSHSHTNPTTANNGTPVLGAQTSMTSGGTAFLYGTPGAGQSSAWHVHDQLHSHTQGSTSSDAHTHTQGATGSSSTIQAGAALHFIIKT